MSEISQDILFDNGSHTVPEWKHLELREKYDKLQEKAGLLELELQMGQE